METKLTLKESTLDAIQDLIQTNLDSAQCLEEAAKAIDHYALTNYFTGISTARRQHAKEFSTFVAANREEPTEESTFRADVRQLWIRIRSAINGGDAKVVLIEAERAEDVIKAKYEQLLVETGGSAMNDVLMRQMREVKAHHDQIRDLRDAA